MFASGELTIFMVGHSLAVFEPPKIYWTNNGAGTVQKANLDGSNKETLVSSLNSPMGLALDIPNNKMYWISNGDDKIQRSNLDGSSVEDVLIGLSNPRELTLVGSYIYWTDGATDIIERIKKDGTGRETILGSFGNMEGIKYNSKNDKIYFNRNDSTLPSVWSVGVNIPSGDTTTARTDLERIIGPYINNPVGLRIDSINQKIYWSDDIQHNINSIDFDGSGIQTVVSVGLYTPDKLAIDSSGAKLYWIDQAKLRISRVNLDGSSLEHIVTSGLSNPTAIALDRKSNKIWWADDTNNNIERSDLDGSNREEMVDNSNNKMNQPTSIDIDQTNDKVYWLNAQNPQRQILRMNKEIPGGQTASNRNDIEVLVSDSFITTQNMSLDVVGNDIYWVGSEVDAMLKAGKNLPSGQQPSERNDIQRIVISGLISANDVLVHAASGKIYWSDLSRDVIRRCNLDGSSIENFVTSVSNADGLTLDTANNRLYWVDSVDDTVERIDLDGSNRTTMLTGSPLEAARRIAIDPSGGKIYWCDQTQNGSWRMDLEIPGGQTNANRRDLQFLYGRNFHNPIHLSIDKTNGKIYWCDNEQNNISRCDLDGSNIEKFATSGMRGPRSLAVDEVNGNIFLMEFDLTDIVKIPTIIPSGQTAFNRDDIEAIIDTGLSLPIGIAYDPSGNKVYWTDAGANRIERSDADGSNRENVITNTDDLPITSLRRCVVDAENGKLYFNSNTSQVENIGRCNLNGSDPEMLIGKLMNRPLGITVDTVNEKMYWTERDNDRILRSDLDGTNIQHIFSSGLKFATKITVDPSGNKIYWTDQTLDRLYKADLDGSNAEILVTNASGLNDPVGVAVDISGSKVYWTNRFIAEIQRSNLDGTEVETIVPSTSGLSQPYDMIIDQVNQKMYWTDIVEDDIKRSNLDGTDVEIIISTGVSDNEGITIDPSGGKIYYTDFNLNTIKRANLDGSSVETIINSGLSAALGISINPASGHIYWLDLNLNRLSRATTSGTDITTILSEDNFLPDVEDIAVDAASGMIYWADDSDNNIVRGSISGTFQSSDVEVLVTGVNPVALSIDPDNNYMYWVNIVSASDMRIQRSRMNGSDVTTLISNQNVDLQPFGITIDSENGQLYISDANQKTIGKFNLDGTSGTNIVGNIMINPKGVAIDPSGEKIYITDIDTDIIYNVNLDGSNPVPLINSLSDARDIAIDNINNKLYWTDINSNIVQRADINGQNQETIVTGVNNPWGVAVDPSGGKIYFADEGADRIYSANLDGSNLTILTSSINGPTELDIDPSTQTIFWAADANDRIQSVAFSGGSVTDLITSNITTTQGLAVDRVNQKVYWSDTKDNSMGIIERCDFNGSNRETFIQNQVPTPTPFGLAFDNENLKLYWVSRDSNDTTYTLYRTDTSGAIVETVITTLNYNGRDIDFDDGKIYFLDSTNRYIKRVATSGTNNDIEDVVRISLKTKNPFDLRVDPANNKVYWTDTARSEIMSSDIDGSGVSTFVGRRLVEPKDIVIDTNNNKVYWSDTLNDIIQRSDINGSGVETVLYDAGLVDSNYMAFDPSGGHLYWTDIGGVNHRILRMSVSGSIPQTLFSDLSSPMGIDIDYINRKIYWAEDGLDRIARSNLNGSNLEIVVSSVSGVDTPTDITIDISGSRVFWGDASGIMSANTDGTNVQLVVSVSGTIGKLSIDHINQKLYWIDDDNKVIERSDLNGSNREDFVTAGLINPLGIRIDNINDRLYILNVNENSFGGNAANRNKIAYVGLTIPSGSTASNRQDFTTVLDTLDVDPVAVDIDVDNNKIYFISTETKNINRSNLDGTSIESILSSNIRDSSFSPINAPFGVDIDPINDKIYISSIDVQSNHKIVRSDFDGENTEDIILNTFRTPMGLAFNGGLLYWGDQLRDTIQSVNVDGTNIQTVINKEANGTILSDPVDLDIDPVNQKVYWTSALKRNIRRANLDNTESDIIVIVGPSDTINGIAFDPSGQKIYWTENGADVIKRCDPDGFNIEELVTSGINSPAGITVDPTTDKIYWVSDFDGAVYSADTDGGNVQTIVVGLDNPVDITVDVVNQKLYWVNDDDGTIEKSDTDGSNREIIITGLTAVVGIVFDPDNNNICWLDSGAGLMSKADPDGSNIENIIQQFDVEVNGIGVDNIRDDIYFSDSLNGVGAGNIYKASLKNINSTIPQEDVDPIVSGLNNPFGIALDADPKLSLFLLGDEPDAELGSVDLFVSGFIPQISGDISLFASGSSAPETSGLFDKIVDIFDKTSDFSPQIIGKFSQFANSVTIEVWSIIGGTNRLLTLVDNTCSEIGNTNRFFWSTDNLPVADRDHGQYVFQMTGNTGETFEGEFFLKNPSDGQWKHPDEFDDYIL